MADDFDTAWENYMQEYNACDPAAYLEDLQSEVNKRVEQDISD